MIELLYIHLKRINDPHGFVTIKADQVTLDKNGQSKIFLNGKPLTSATLLHHLDRLLFGSSQYFVFYDPKQKKDGQVIPTFEDMQNEIAKSSGLLNDNSNMSHGI